jgi:hypothetical protein
MSGDFLKNIALAIVGVVGGLLILAYSMQYAGKYMRRGFNVSAPSQSPSLIMVVGVLAGIVLVLWGLLAAFRPTSASNLTPEKGTLDKETRVGSSRQVYNDFYYGTSGGSFGVYVYLNNYDRTPRASGTDGIPFIRIGPFKLYINNNNDAYTTYAEVELKENNTGDSKRIILDNFPLQKWVYLTVNREGRRFSVYYNDSIAGTKLFDSFYARDPDPLKIGGSAYIGRYLYPNLNSTVMRVEDIRAHIQATADSKGKPYEKKDITEMLFGTSLFCTGGDCLTATTKPPSGYHFRTSV